MEQQALPIKTILSGDDYIVSISTYYLPIVVALLVNLRVLTYWIFFFFRRGFTILQMLLVVQTLGTITIQVDNLIFYQKTMIPTFSLLSTLWPNLKFRFVLVESFIKFQISFRDMMLYVPHAVCFTVITGILLKHLRENQLNGIRWIVFVLLLFGATNYMVSRFKELKVEFVRYYDFSAGVELQPPGSVVRRLAPNYIKVTEGWQELGKGIIPSAKRHFADRTYTPIKIWNEDLEPYERMDEWDLLMYGHENARTFFEFSEQRLYFLSELHTDGWTYPPNRVYGELAMLTIALVYHSIYYCKPRWYGDSTTRLVAMNAITQYLLMRYPSIRTTIWNTKSFPLACNWREVPYWDDPDKRKCFTSDLTALLWHRAAYFGMLVVALHSLKIAKFLGAISLLGMIQTIVQTV